MKQELDEMHETDTNGNPAGGQTMGTGLAIRWQKGPLGKGTSRKEPNGAFVEGVLQAALGRLQYYQDSQYKCMENALAITKIREAIHWLNARTQDREERGVEGLHEK